MIKFSIILIIKDDAHLLQCMLLSLRNLMFRHDEFEVIVIDDGSDRPITNQLEVPANLSLRHFYVPRDATSSRAKARNLGAAHAQGEYLVFLDGDHFADLQLLRRYDQYFATKSQRQVVLGKRRHLRHHLWSPIRDALRHQTDLQPILKDYNEDERSLLLSRIEEPFDQLLGRWHLFWSCNFCIKSSLFSEIGGFDENFIGWGLEDVELGYRLLQRGCQFELLDNYAWHFLRENAIDGAKYQSWLRNIQYFYRKFDDPAILTQFSFEDVFFYSATAPKEIIVDWYACFINFERKLRFQNSNRE